MKLTKFEKKVFEACKKIPKGKVATYKTIAESIGSNACRAVGNALNKNPYKNVPCHRVIRSDRSIGGFVRGSDEKIRRLLKEGIIIQNQKVNKDQLINNF